MLHGLLNLPLLRIIYKLLTKKPIYKVYTVEKNTKKLIDSDTVIEIDITTKDIIDSIPYTDNSILGLAIKRHGIVGKCTPCLIKLNNGEELHPEVLKDHWLAYLGSHKFKPCKIKYVLKIV